MSCLHSLVSVYVNSMLSLFVSTLLFMDFFCLTSSSSLDSRDKIRKELEGHTALGSSQLRSDILREDFQTGPVFQMKVYAFAYLSMLFTILTDWYYVKRLLPSNSSNAGSHRDSINESNPRIQECA